MQFIIFRIVGKITVIRKWQKFNWNGTPPWIFALKTSEIFIRYFGWCLPTDKNIFNVSNNVTSIASIDFFIIKSGHFHSCQLFLISMRGRKQSTFLWYKKIMIIIIITIIIIIMIIIISFSKAWDFYYKWQWWSLWRSLLLSPFVLVCFQ